MQDELADVKAQIECTERSLKLDTAYMARRSADKVRQMAEWESHFVVDNLPDDYEVN